MLDERGHILYTNAPSRYLPIWHELKTKGKVRLAVPPPLHRRIIKAVKKRKDKDIAFRYQLSEEGKKAWLKFSIIGTVIEITLVTTIGVNDI